MTKLKWNWIKFWGHRFLFISPTKHNNQYIIYRRKIFDLNCWNDFFKEGLNDSKA